MRGEWVEYETGEKIDVESDVIGEVRHDNCKMVDVENSAEKKNNKNCCHSPIKLHNLQTQPKDLRHQIQCLHLHH